MLLGPEVGRHIHLESMLLYRANMQLCSITFCQAGDCCGSTSAIWVSGRIKAVLIINTAIHKLRFISTTVYWNTCTLEIEPYQYLCEINWNMSPTMSIKVLHYLYKIIFVYHLKWMRMVSCSFVQLLSNCPHFSNVATSHFTGLNCMIFRLVCSTHCTMLHLTIIIGKQVASPSHWQVKLQQSSLT